MRNWMKAMACTGVMALCVNSTAIAQMASASDKMFLKESAQADMAEIQEGKLAQQNSNNQDVKNFGQKMIDDHNHMTDTMKPIAEKNGVKPPTMLAPKDQAMVNKLQGLHGAAFDKAYMHGAVMDHTAVLAKVKAENARTHNPDLKQATSDAIPVVQSHLDMAKNWTKANGGM